MKKLCAALILFIFSIEPAYALIDYTSLRGTWEVKGTIYRLGPGDGRPTAAIEENLVEIGQVAPFLLEIGERDYAFGYAEWESDETKQVLAALEAFLSGGMTNGLNEALGQLPKVPYLFLPDMDKHDYRDLGMPIDGWYGFDTSFPEIKYPVKGKSLSRVFWYICNDFSRPESWQHDYATLLFDDVLGQAFANLNLFAMIGLKGIFTMNGYFAGEESHSLNVRFLNTYYPNGSVAETYMFYYKLTMERR